MVSPAKPAPVVSFFQFIPRCRPPQRADKSAAGTLPTRAFRYCDAVVTATGFGWHMFSPLDLTLIWDGTDIIWTYEGSDGWFPLTVAQFPGFRDYFDRVAPPSSQSYAPPFLAALPEPGVVQLWTGFFAKTAPDWSLLIRPPANPSCATNYRLYEGIVEADRWFVPVFTNLILTKTDVPIKLRMNDLPIVQIQPIHRQVCDESILNAYEVVPSLEHLSTADWQDFHRSVVAVSDSKGDEHGAYAVAVRKRRQAEKAQPTTTSIARCPMARG